MSELYENIMKALMEVREIESGRLEPAGVVEMPKTPKQVREKLNLSQPEFADFVGVKLATLRNWEQGRSKVPSIARRLLTIADKHPEIILEIIGQRAQKKPACRRIRKAGLKVANRL